MLTETDLNYLRRCVKLAEQAFATGSPPFGSVLVGADGDSSDRVRSAPQRKLAATLA